MRMRAVKNCVICIASHVQFVASNTQAAGNGQIANGSVNNMNNSAINCVTENSACPTACRQEQKHIRNIKRYLRTSSRMCLLGTKHFSICVLHSSL